MEILLNSIRKKETMEATVPICLERADPPFTTITLNQCTASQGSLAFYDTFDKKARYSADRSRSPTKITATKNVGLAMTQESCRRPLSGSMQREFSSVEAPILTGGATPAHG